MMGKNRKDRTMMPLCRHIAKRKLFDNKMQGSFMAVAAILTTVLFTTAFAAFFQFSHSIRETQMESVAWTAHAAISDVTDAQYEIMKQSSVVSMVSSYRHLGFITEESQDEVIELQYSEDTMASWMYYGLTQGRMPQAEDEIAVSSQFLEGKGISVSDALGTQIQIQYTVNDRLFSGDFVVCGFYEQKASSSEVAFISERFLGQALGQVADEPVMDGVLGIRVAEVMFQNTFRMERDMERLLAEAGAMENRWMLNPAYTAASGLGARGNLAVACVLLLIMLCGYFIIYNIFYISIMQDTRFYGSLATLGFHGWELKQIVKYKTNRLCAISIPAGLLLGFLFSMSFLPRILKTFGDGSHALPNPLLFVCAAAFSYLTMRISSRKPAKMAAAISPIGARRYVAQDVRKAAARQASKRSGGKGAKNAKASRNGHKLHIMAWKNIVREQKKSIFICCSLAICMVLASLFYTVSACTDIEVFMEDAISCDFIVACNQYFNRVGSENLPLDSSLISSLNQRDGIQGAGGAHAMVMPHVTLGQEAYQRYKEILDEAGQDDTNYAGVMYAHVFGLDEFICSKMKLVEGELDWEKFQSGDYIIANWMNESDRIDRSLKKSCYVPGDKLKLDLSDEKEYTVLAIADIPYDLTHGQFPCSVNLYLPSQEWIRRMQSQEYYMYAYDVEEIYEPQWEGAMAALAGGEADFGYESKAMMREQFLGFFNGIFMLGISVSIILGVIGLMNFVNAMYSSIYVRRRELAVMQSMGMLKKQIYRMLAAEGGYYMMASWLAGTVVGMPLSYFVTTSLGNQMSFIQYRWNPLPYFIFGAAGFVLAISIPCMIFHSIDKREGLLRRLRDGLY